MYRKKGFRPLPWTYPDYQSDAYQQFFRELRRLYMTQLAQGESAGGEDDLPAR
jgi:hypothetical protein